MRYEPAEGTAMPLTWKTLSVRLDSLVPGSGREQRLSKIIPAPAIYVLEDNSDIGKSLVTGKGAIPPTN